MQKSSRQFGWLRDSNWVNSSSANDKGPRNALSSPVPSWSSALGNIMFLARLLQRVDGGIMVPNLDCTYTRMARWCLHGRAGCVNYTSYCIWLSDRISYIYNDSSTNGLNWITESVDRSNPSHESQDFQRMQIPFPARATSTSHPPRIPMIYLHDFQSTEHRVHCPRIPWSGIVYQSTMIHI